MQFEETAPPVAPIDWGTPHHAAALSVEAPRTMRTILKDVPPPSLEALESESGAPDQGDHLDAQEWEQGGERTSSRREQELVVERPELESEVQGIIVSPPSPGDHVREFEGKDATTSFPPDTVVAVGSQHVVESVNRGISVFDKFGNEVLGYRTFTAFFDNPAGMSLFDPKIIWSSFHDKFALLVLGRDTSAQESRFYLAISDGPNAMEGWSWWSFNAESLGDADAWLDFASLGGDEWGLYVTGNMLFWGAGFKHSKLWAISPSAWNGVSPSNWVWLDLEWPSGANAYSLEVAHPHTSAFDDATFLVNTHRNSGSDALVWRVVGNRQTGAGLFLSRSQVDIDDYDAIGGNVNQPGSSVDINGFGTNVGNAVYANRRVFFSLTTDPLDDTTRSALLTNKVHVDSGELEWDHLLSPGSGNYYMYPALTLAGTSPGDNLAVFYSYTSTPDVIYPSSGYKLYTNQPNNSSGPNRLYQQGQEPYVQIDSQGRNRWGDYSGAAYDWQCGHLWGATELSGTSNSWRTRIKAINGSGEFDCSMIAVVSPNGGEILAGGDDVLVTWDRSAVPSGTLLNVFLDVGEFFPFPVALDLPASSTSALLEVPNFPTSEARIFVGAWDGDQYLLSDWGDQTFTIAGTPDLVTSIDPPAEAFVGREIEVPNTLENIGEASSPVTSSIALSTNSICSTSDTLLLTRIGGNVGAGQTNQAVSTVEIPADTVPGSYHLCAIADWSNTVDEFDETNNASGAPIQILELPNLIFEDGFEAGAADDWDFDSQ